MADYQLVIIGAGLSGLAAGIRAARFGHSTLILEQHHRPGGLNSWYHRQGHLLETGLHAMTNFAPASQRHAPLNLLFRQLKLSRKQFIARQQFGSEIVFPGTRLRFANDPEVLTECIGAVFPQSLVAFQKLVAAVKAHDPFTPAPWRSARRFVSSFIRERLLVDMLLLPLMVYGNACEHDMDLNQFVIMFRAVFLEGFFRPEATMREFLAMLVEHFAALGGDLQLRARVRRLVTEAGHVQSVELENGERIRARVVLSTAGIPATAHFIGWELPLEEYTGRMSFMETIALLPSAVMEERSRGRTIIFFNTREQFHYRRPREAVDTSWGVICFPDQFQGRHRQPLSQIRVTSAANATWWNRQDQGSYQEAKTRWSARSVAAAEKIVGNYQSDIVYGDCFTPRTIARFTAKAAGAVYGSPRKIQDGRTPWENLFIAGTDQGFLGIVGAMLSGVTIVNEQVFRLI